MKRFVLTLFVLLFATCANAQIITGEVQYNADVARSEVFSKPIEKISFDKIYNHFFDSENIENLNSLFQGITELKDRKLAKFSDGSYGIQYYDDPMFTWYYSESGKLINFTQKDSNSYPCRITKYKPDGSIANTGYRVSNKESFIFDNNGKLLAHWLGNNCYDEQNNIIMTRKIMY
jgi:hypothetical protein